MAIKKKLNIANVLKKIKEQGGQNNIGKFQKPFGNSVDQKLRLPQTESSFSTQSNEYIQQAKQNQIYTETQNVSMFGRTTKTTSNLLRSANGSLNNYYAPKKTGCLSIRLQTQGVIVGGTEGGIGNCFEIDSLTLFKITETGVTQLGTSGGIHTTRFSDSNVGTPSIYVNFNDTVSTSTNRTLSGSVGFVIKNTGERITEWTSQITFVLNEHMLHQSGESGGALWQNGSHLLFQDYTHLLWN